MTKERQELVEVAEFLQQHDKLFSQTEVVLAMEEQKPIVSANLPIVSANFALQMKDYMEEIIHHCSIAFSRCANFFGRETLVKLALEKIRTNVETSTRVASEGNTMFSGIHLVLIGKSGSGKTALMSKLALLLVDPTIPTIIRFCGTSKFSLDGLKLIQNISVQILVIYDKKDELKKLLVNLPSQDYKTAVDCFQKLMTEYPVSLFIDSLDQLENRYEERSRLTFLRNIKPHEKSRIIVSALPDEYNEDGKPGKYFYQCEKTLKSGSVPSLAVGAVEAIETTFKELLERRHRKLTPDQWIVTLRAVEHEPTILYINLAMEVITQWRSFDKEIILKPTAKGLVEQIFNGMEKNFGRNFTAIAFALITYSREGVNDPEMQDLLSLHDGVMNEVCQYSKLHCFPMHAWLRLKYVMKNLVAEKENHCIKWYHRQLWDTAKVRYIDKKKECHSLMGKYFLSLYDKDLMKEKDIMEQPLLLNDVSVWLPGSVVNRRRVVEGYYHLIEGGLTDETVEEVCSVEFVCASALCADIFNLLRYMSLCLASFNCNEDKKKKFHHYLRWIRKKAGSIASNPSWMTRSTAGEESWESEVRTPLSVLSASRENEPVSNWNKCDIMTCVRYRRFDSLEMELLGHSKASSSVSWNIDSSKIISGSDDKTIKVWNARTGELLNTLEGHHGEVSSVAWDHTSSKIVSGSYDHTVGIWDAETGDLLHALKGHSGKVSSVSWNHDSSKIVSGSLDKTIKIWDAGNGELLNTLDCQFGEVSTVSWNHDSTQLVAGLSAKVIVICDCRTGELLNTLNGHTDAILSVSWNRDSSKLVSGSKDGKIKIWDGKTGKMLNTLESHFGGVTLEDLSVVITSVSWNHDSSKIVSGSGDQTIRIWDTQTGTLLHTLEGHSRMVSSVSWNADSSKIVSGSYDQTIKIWDVGEMFDTLEGHSGEISTVSWNHDSSKIVSGSLDKTMKVWDGRTGELVNTLGGHSRAVSSVAWNRDGSKIVSGSNDKTIQIRDGRTGELMNELLGHTHMVFAVSWNHDSSRIVSGSRDKTIRIWDATEGALLTTLCGHVDGITSVSFNHDSGKISSGSYDQTIKIWDAVNGELLSTLEGHSDVVTSASWNRDSSKLVSGSWDKTINIWDTRTGNLSNTLQGHSDMVLCVSWNHDSSQIVSGSRDKTIIIWDALNAKLLYTLEGHSDAVSTVSWNHDSSKLVSGSTDKTIKVWCITAAH
jgi:WD40 repeat protein/energy-coupling factor transporter ATP-binding protein EcfA2